MIGAKLSDQRNSRNAGRFKSTNQRLASSGGFQPQRAAAVSQALIGRFGILVRWMGNLEPRSHSV